MFTIAWLKDKLAIKGTYYFVKYTTLIDNYINELKPSWNISVDESKNRQKLFRLNENTHVLEKYIIFEKVYMSAENGSF